MFGVWLHEYSKTTRDCRGVTYKGNNLKINNDTLKTVYLQAWDGKSAPPNELIPILSGVHVDFEKPRKLSWVLVVDSDDVEITIKGRS